MHRTSVPQTHPPGAGWQEWLYRRPPYGTRVEVWRKGRQQVTVINPDDMPPLMNVAGLLWRACGNVAGE